MEKQSLYLYEREYGPEDAHPAAANPSVMDFWHSIIGEDFFKQIYENFPAVRAYCAGRPYVADKENCRLKRQQKQQKRIEVSDSDRDLVTRFLAKQGSGGFAWFYEDDLAEVLASIRLRMSDESICADEAWEDYLNIVLSRLETVGIRTLIHEMQAQKADGCLQGNDGREEYEHFTETSIKNGIWREQIYTKYPVLRRCITEVAEMAADLASEALCALSSDKPEIEEKFCRGADFRQAVKIHGSLSDMHRNGKSVLKFDLDNGCTIIYKPHSMKNEAVFYALAQKMAEKCHTDMYQPCVVDRAQYGWSECISYEHCTDMEQLKRYYYRMGIYLFLAYLLGTHDIHCENVISHGEYPVVIDLENILGYQDQEESDDLNQTIRNYIQTSVLYSGILPYYQWQKAGGIVHSAIGTAVNREYSVKLPVVKGQGTSDMRIEYAIPKSGPAQNAAMLGDEFVDPANFTDAIADGFAAAYHWGLEHKEELKGWLRPLEGITGRCLCADTQRYAMLLNSSVNPLLMDDGASRQIYMYTLFFGRNIHNHMDRAVVESEVKDLLNHDIPYFYMKASGTSLYDSRGKELPEYFAAPPVRMMYQRLDRLDAQDLIRQTELIQASMELKSGQSENLINDYLSPELQQEEQPLCKDELLELSEAVADYLLYRAVRSKSGDIGWYSIHVNSSGSYGWNIAPLDLYFYDGVGGLAVYFRMLAKTTGKDKYLDVCRNLEGQLFRYTDMVCEDTAKCATSGTGAYNGESSLIYVYLLLHQMTGDQSYLDYAVKHGTVSAKLLEEDPSYDLLEGIAGAAYILCMLYGQTGDQRHLEWARRAGRRLIDEAVTDQEGACWKARLDTLPLLGLSHGNAGIMLAFAALYRATGNKLYEQWMEKALIYEDAHYDERIRNWLDLRGVMDEADAKKADVAAWCHGAGGILLSRLMIQDLLTPGTQAEAAVTEDIRKAAKKLKEKGVRKGMCLCHGTCGNLLILQEHTQGAEGAGAMVKRLHKDRRALLPQEHFNPGLMSGYTGIGYYLLRLYDGGLPDILRLER